MHGNSKLNDLIVEKAIRQFDGNIEEISEFLGVCKKTIYKHIGSNDRLHTELIEARRGKQVQKLDAYEKRLDHLAAQNESLTVSLGAVKYFLQTQGKKRGYGEVEDESKKATNLADFIDMYHKTAKTPEITDDN